jgi:hypothetical protein
MLRAVRGKHHSLQMQKERKREPENELAVLMLRQPCPDFAPMLSAPENLNLPAPAYERNNIAQRPCPGRRAESHIAPDARKQFEHLMRA